MDIRTGLSMTEDEVLSLLEHFDDSSDTPLHLGLDFDSYSRKLSSHACFVTAVERGSLLGFISYYLNDEGHFAYVPQTVVHREGRHRGIGHAMFTALYDCLDGSYGYIRLEVLKSNANARAFYEREGFVEIEDHCERLLLERKL